jgi:hypothetical protein
VDLFQILTVKLQPRSFASFVEWDVPQDLVGNATDRLNSVKRQSIARVLPLFPMGPKILWKSMVAMKTNTRPKSIGYVELDTIRRQESGLGRYRAAVLRISFDNQTSDR